MNHGETGLRLLPPVGRAIRELPPAERPRERLQLRGAAGLTAAELIGLLWGSGSRGRSAVDVAADAIARFDGLTGLARASGPELEAIPGVGEARAAQLLAAFELGRRLLADWPTGRWSIRSPRDVAADAIARFDGLTGLARASGPELEAIPGVGEARAAQLLAAFELGRRLLADWPTGRWSIRSPRDVADRLILQMGRLEREELRVVILNTKNVVLRVSTVYQGNVSASLVRVGELFRDAVRLDAAGTILVHNHPSGDPTPSPDDLHLTAEALAAGRLLDIDLLDHLVIGHDAYVSLRDRGVSFDRPGRHPPAA